MTFSESHYTSGERLLKLLSNCKNLNDVEEKLKINKILYEKVNLATGTQLFIFTGSSGYDIVGWSILYEKGFILREF